MKAKFSKGVKQIISMAFEEAVRLNSKYVSAEHLFLSLVKTGDKHTLETLESLGADAGILVQEIENTIRINEVRTNKPGLDKTAEKILKESYRKARLYRSKQNEPFHILGSILHDENEVTRQLAIAGIDHDSIVIGLSIKKNKFFPARSPLKLRERIKLINFAFMIKFTKDQQRTDRKIVELMAKDIFIKGGTSNTFQDRFYAFLDDCKVRKDEKEFLYLMEIFKNIRGKYI